MKILNKIWTTNSHTRLVSGLFQPQFSHTISICKACAVRIALRTLSDNNERRLDLLSASLYDKHCARCYCDSALLVRCFPIRNRNEIERVNKNRALTNDTRLETTDWVVVLVGCWFCPFSYMWTKAVFLSKIFILTEADRIGL